MQREPVSTRHPLTTFFTLEPAGHASAAVAHRLHGSSGKMMHAGLRAMRKAAR